jgi:hypothetical protein
LGLSNIPNTEVIPVSYNPSISLSTFPASAIAGIPCFLAKSAMPDIVFPCFV